MVKKRDDKRFNKKIKKKSKYCLTHTIKGLSKTTLRSVSKKSLKKLLTISKMFDKLLNVDAKKVAKNM